ncbi:class I SAM-dependent DNA methyltransferase [Algoriphagus zhangzhouensis]|uniref:Methyltransferase domain-containing protein n=1 Tax=Algoriphagus zhangzhouensis TaxID=1073327 RepID=A0A1M7ZI31_9BACT|nr:class I SAM-dependent methyltransferase [Algoriphagus zhangzhouensis]TDY44272.1 methyltransferase family protein [Algoriphagus zhangzhouensis]SHO64482.1 Methyltransferase domain-containing protein [Algoriphagus zhangzhouensis]
MSLDNLNPIIRKTQSRLSPEEFHHVVNVVFHDFESEDYDQIHKDMWEVLLQQFNLLTSDFSASMEGKTKITLLDIGCGTGLGTELFLATELGKKVDKVILVDVSSKMMEKALERSQSWGVELESFVGKINEVNLKADIILTSSVLHHIPNLEEFFKDVIQRLNQGGVFMHIHDPNGDQLHNPALIKRRNEIASHDKVTNVYQWLNSSEILKSIFHRVNRIRGRYNHIDLVNNALLEKGVIKKRMNAKEIWSITDIHVEGLPYSKKKGILLSEMKTMLSPLELVGQRSYGFYGRLGFELDKEYTDLEQNLIKSGSKEGRYLAAAWKKN